MSSQPCNQNLLLYVICVIRRYRMNLGGGVLLGLKGNHVSTGKTFSFLTSGAHCWQQTGIEWTMMDPGLGRVFDQSPVYIRAYVG